MIEEKRTSHCSLENIGAERHLSGIAAWSIIALSALLLTYVFCMIACGRGSTIGPASLLAKVLIGGIAVVAALLLGVIQAISIGRVATTREAIATKYGLSESVQAALTLRTLFTIVFGAFVLVLNFRTVSQSLTGKPSRVSATIIDIKYSQPTRAICVRTATVRIDFAPRSARFCVETQYGVRVDLDGVRLGVPVLLDIRVTPFYMVVDGVN